MSVPDPCTILTSTNFGNLAPSAVYTYSGLCTAITSWNTANPSNQIFMGATELDRKNELAAFLGHTLHESGDFQYPRELSQCGTTATDSGTLYCQPTGYSAGDGSISTYCQSTNTPTSDPDGCTCGAVANTSPFGYDADALFFGRGPMQLSWNYNYIDAGAALGVDLCANPDLVATDAATGWGTAIWFWMENTGSVGVSSHVGVTDNGSFGETLNTINGGLECNAAVTSHIASTTQRLNKYCGAVTELGANLLSFDGCTNLQSLYDTCVAGGTCTACDNVTPAPTPSPTPAPTPSPTPAPVPTNPPTLAPTSPPTTAPTAQPTTSPTTAQPTKSPTPPPTNPPTTAQPTKSPTPPPTSPPTKSPTPPPTRSPTPFEWYPDWAGADEGCKADGNEPRYMSLNPSGYMYTEQATCCETHYSWMYGACMNLNSDGTDVGGGGSTLPTGKYFPDWLSSGTCKEDEGDAPDYMRGAGSTWMKDTLGDCCSHHFSWNYDDCAGTDGSGSGGSAADGKYYPNWEQGKNECLNDGNQETYMSNNPSVYMYDTLEDCCTWHFSWTLASCLGSAGGVAAGTEEWYVDWTAGTNGLCVQDCLESNGGSCGGLAAPWEPLSASKSVCCSTHKSWDDDCLST